jgi:GAF domain-containing protein
MKRRTTAGPERPKSRRRKTITQKRRGLRKPSTADHKTQSDVAQFIRERDEALEREKATAEVLRVISSLPGELEPVFQAMLANAVRICEAKFGILFRYDRAAFYAAASIGVPPAYAEFLRGTVHVSSEHPHNPLTRLERAKEVVHSPNLIADQAYIERNPRIVALVESGGARSWVGVPMLKEGELIGAIIIYRQEVRPFTDKQIELVKSFAAQAVIAIENTRLLNELQQRTDDLSESLEQQTATSDVLGVISNSPGELKLIFKAMLESAVRICGAKFGNLWLREGGSFRIAATHGAPAAYREYFAREPVVVPEPKSGLAQILEGKGPISIDDIRAAGTYKDGMRRATIELAGARSLFGVPMLKDNEVVGGIAIYRQEVRPFTGKQIALVQNFASQAVIAIENARLLSELRESLQQQTATADVLKVISRSTFDLQAVLDTLVESAARLCDADTGNIWRPKGAEFQVAAFYRIRRTISRCCRANPSSRGEAPASAVSCWKGRSFISTTFMMIPTMR